MILSPNAHAEVFSREAEAKGREYHALLGRRALDLVATHQIVPALLPNPDDAVLHIASKRLLREDWMYSLAVLGEGFDNWRAWGHVTLSELCSTSEPFAELVKTGRRASLAQDGAVHTLRLSEVPLDFLRACNPNQAVALVPARPPLEYLYRLAHYVGKTFSDSILGVKALRSTWSPRLLSNLPQAAVVESLRESTVPVVVQGPPGTGKTYLAAEIIADAIAMGQRTCVTAQSHRGLMELAAKPALSEALQAGRLRKRGLTTAEHRELPGLALADELVIGPQQLLLVTYYSLSKWVVLGLPEHPPYDLLVIEEASQAFLATLSLFSRLARRVLIIGDPQQLPPVLEFETFAFAKLTKKKAEQAVIRGLETLAHNGDIVGMRLTQTWRLGHRAAALTGLFYDDTLRSVRDRADTARSPTAYPPVLAVAASAGDGPVLLRSPGSASDLSQWVLAQADKLTTAFPEASLALMLPTALDVRNAQARTTAYPRLRRARIETVDRMQGATVDFAFYVVGDLARGFALDPKRFNVATSRARQQTWVVVKGEGFAAAWGGGVVGRFWSKMIEPGQPEQAPA